MAVKTQNLIRTTLPGWCGLAALFVSFPIAESMEQPPYIKASVIIGIMFAAMFCVEAILCIRGKFGLLGAPCQRPLKLSRIMIKIMGWTITVLTVASAYWVFPEYLGIFYTPYYLALKATGVYLVAFFLFCILWEDPRSDQEFDDYYWLASAFLNLNFSLLKKANLKQLFLGWVVKLYFLPLMFIYFVGDLNFHANYGSVLGVYDTAYNFIYLVDVAFVCVGYIFANALTDTHIRSTDPTLLGWIAALICYQPFWSLIGSNYISYGSEWGPWLTNHPQLQLIWAVLIIVCLLLYIWATIAFGSRLSNLTHRGILTCGPYAYLRHPAYIGKLSSFFLIYIPFVGKDLITTVRYLILWGLLVGIYYIRAKTEEANLRSVGPEYDIYANEVAQRWKKILKH